MSVPPFAPISSSNLRARVQYDYEKVEDNELSLETGQLITHIDMVDEHWWIGSSRDERGLFPSNYVTIVNDDIQYIEPPVTSSGTEPIQSPTGSPRPSATALFDYEAADDNGKSNISLYTRRGRQITNNVLEIGFPEGACISNLEFLDEDWWYGSYGNKSGLFPASYVQLDS
jgi:hypothetical protein